VTQAAIIIDPHAAAAAFGVNSYSAGERKKESTLIALYYTLGQFSMIDFQPCFVTALHTGESLLLLAVKISGGIDDKKIAALRILHLKVFNLF